MATTIQSGRSNSPLLTADVASRAEVYGGRGLVFDGVVDVAQTPSIDLGTTHSVSCWIKTSTGSKVVVGIDTSNYPIYLNSNLQVNYDAATTAVGSTDALISGAWNHVVVTRSGTTVNYYINGKVDSGGADTMGANNSLSGVFGLGGVSGFYFNGSMADVKFFDAQLTEAQVQELYLKPEQSAPSAVQDNLVAWYPMSEANPESPQSIVYDHSEKGLSAEKATGTTWTKQGVTGEVAEGSGNITHRVASEGNGTQAYRPSFNLTTTSGKVYKLVITPISKTGTVSPLLHNGSSYLNIADGGDWTWDGNSTKTYYYIGGGGGFISFDGRNTFDITFTMSFKEVLMGQNATTNFFGDELVDTNARTFESTSTYGWGAYGSNTIANDSNTLKITRDDNNQGAYWFLKNASDLSTDLTVGKRYLLSGDFLTTDASLNYTVRVSNGSEDITHSGLNNTSFATKTFEFTAQHATNTFLVVESLTGTQIVKVDNLSFKEVGISSTGFTTAQNEPLIPQIPLVKYNEKMLFDGVDDKVVLDGAISALATQHGTINLWCTPHPSSSGSEDNLFTYNNSSTRTDLLFRYNWDDNRLQIGIAQSGTQKWYAYSANGSITSHKGTMNMITLSHNGTEPKLYANGIELSITYGTNTDKTFWLGDMSGVDKCALGLWQYSSDTNQFNGIIDDVSYFNTALTQTQIQELFNDGVALDATTHSKADDHLLGYWRNDGVTTWTDRSDIQAIGFDGSDDYIDCGTGIGNTLGDNYAGDFSVSMWFNADANSNGLFNAGTSFGGDHGEFSIIAGGNFVIYFNDAGYNKQFTAPSTGTWNHIAVSFDASSESNLKIFLNGSQVSYSGSGGSFPSAGDLDFNNTKIIIGAYHSSSYMFNGKIGQTTFYNKALSETELSGIYTLGRHGNLLDSYSDNLLGYWLLNPTHSNPDLTGSNKILDRSGNGNHGTQNGGVNFLGTNDGTVAGTPDSITIREGLNSNKDGLGFPLKNADSHVLRLNGVDEHLKLPYTKSFNMGDGSFTVTAWIKTTLGVGDSIQTILWARDNDDSFKGFEFQVDDSADRPRFILSDGTGTECNGSSSTVESNKWHFIAVVVDRESDLAKIFLSESDGSALKCQTTTDISARGNINATPDWYVGKRNSATTQDFMGIIDELMVYNVALTALEADGTTVEATDVVTSGELLKNYKFSKGKHKND